MSLTMPTFLFAFHFSFVFNQPGMKRKKNWFIVRQVDKYVERVCMGEGGSWESLTWLEYKIRS